MDNNKLVFENVTDYDLDETFLCGQAFRWNKYEQGFLGFAGEYLCYVYFENTNLIVESLTDIEDYQLFKNYMFHYLALDLDYKMLKNKFSENEIMKQAISYAEGIRVLNQEFFETLITFIISQNNNIPRIKKIVDTICLKYGKKVCDQYAFPTPQDLKDVTVDEFFELKMGFRAKYVYDAVQKMCNGEINKDLIKEMPYQDAQQYLIKIKGVGPKVADCVLLFSCEKYESFPKDVWINRALDKMFDGVLPECIQGYEGIAQQYIFHYARNNLEK